jgi:hypothetical protein
MSLFVSRFSPDVTSEDIKALINLKEQLKRSSLIYTRLRMKFNTYVSIHISVNEQDFQAINNTSVCVCVCGGGVNSQMVA